MHIKFSKISVEHTAGDKKLQAFSHYHSCITWRTNAIERLKEVFCAISHQKKRITSIIIKFDVVHDRNTNGTIHAKLFFSPVAIYDSWNHWTCYESRVPLVFSMFNVGNVRYSMDAFNIYAPLFWNKRFNRSSIFYPFDEIVFTFFYSKYYYWCCCQIRNFLIRWHCVQPKWKRNVIKPKKIRIKKRERKYMMKWIARTRWIVEMCAVHHCVINKIHMNAKSPEAWKKEPNFFYKIIIGRALAQRCPYMCVLLLWPKSSDKKREIKKTIERQRKRKSITQVHISMYIWFLNYEDNII